MNKIKLASAVICMSLMSTAVFAEMRMGLNAAFSSFDTSGSEKLRQSNNVTNHSLTEDIVVPSVFAEVVGDSGIALGLDYVPVAELGSGTGDDDDLETSGANKASAELASHVTLYVLKETSNGLFVKAGVAFADVDTTENLATGDSYKDTDTRGLMIGFGKHFDLNNMFVRGSVSYTDYEEVSITSAGGSKVTADVDSVAATLSIGKKF